LQPYASYAIFNLFLFFLDAFLFIFRDGWKGLGIPSNFRRRSKTFDSVSHFRTDSFEIVRNHATTADYEPWKRTPNSAPGLPCCSFAKGHITQTAAAAAFK
jgi:hypothetical protein